MEFSRLWPVLPSATGGDTAQSAPKGEASAALVEDCASFSLSEEWASGLYQAIISTPFYSHLKSKVRATEHCTLTETEDFDGRKYGSLQLAWSTDRYIRIKTMPIETSVIEIYDSAGIARQDILLVMLRSYVEQTGLPVDVPEVLSFESQSPGQLELTSEDEGFNARIFIKQRESVGVTNLVISKAL